MFNVKKIKDTPFLLGEHPLEKKCIVGIVTTKAQITNLLVADITKDANGFAVWKSDNRFVVLSDIECITQNATSPHNLKNMDIVVAEQNVQLNITTPYGSALLVANQGDLTYDYKLKVEKGSWKIVSWKLEEYQIKITVELFGQLEQA